MSLDTAYYTRTGAGIQGSFFRRFFHFQEDQGGCARYRRDMAGSTLPSGISNA